MEGNTIPSVANELPSRRLQAPPRLVRQGRPLSDDGMDMTGLEATSDISAGAEDRTPAATPEIMPARSAGSSIRAGSARSSPTRSPAKQSDDTEIICTNVLGLVIEQEEEHT
jgi:hypothetical protein